VGKHQGSLAGRQVEKEVQAMGEIVYFPPTKKSIYRAAIKEVEQMYRLSCGGEDPIVDDSTREMFERGEIDEVTWISWERYCNNVLNILGE
jgi:hypothetical protein